MFGFYKNNENENDEELIQEVRKNMFQNLFYIFPYITFFFVQLIDNVNEEFRNEFHMHIDAFIKSDADSIKLSFGATHAEKNFCQSVCKRNKLSFRELKVDGNANFIITKKT